MSSIEKESTRLKLMEDVKDVLTVKGVGAEEIIKPSTKKSSTKIIW